MIFSDFLQQMLPLLKELNCSFGYQRRNCKKNGHFKRRVVLGVVSYEILIDRLDNDAGMIYTLCHELAHACNKHLDSKVLTYAQKEFVADQVGKLMIEYLGLEHQLRQSHINKKFKLDSYSHDWLKGRKISKERQKIADEQIVSTVLRLLNLIDFHKISKK